MSGASSIEWTDATWNPVRGCSRVSEGCRHCYAENVAARFTRPGLPFEGFAKRVDGDARWTGKVALVPEALDWPLRWHGAPAARAEGRPSRVFVNSMSDLFHEELTDEAIDQVFAVMALAARHTFQVLTKRPERMLAYLLASDRPEAIGWAEHEAYERIGKLPAGAYQGPTHRRLPLPNVWLGTSVENQATADARIPELLACPAAVRFVSYEPALDAVDFTPFLPPPGLRDLLATFPPAAFPLPRHLQPPPALDWLIVGGESGPGARPFDVAWARSTVEQCRTAGVACFVKQLGARPILRCSQCGLWVGRVLGGWTDACGPTHGILISESQSIRDRKGGDWSEWPEDLRVREFPTMHQEQGGGRS